MIIFYGKMKCFSGSSDVFMYECPYCEKINSTTLSIYSYYFHFFWIPVLPIEKTGHAVCTECKASRGESQFGPKLVAEFNQVKNKIRSPWWTWSLTIVVVVIILLIIIAAII